MSSDEVVNPKNTFTDGERDYYLQLIALAKKLSISLKPNQQTEEVPAVNTTTEHSLF